jgi:hypothetical protein
MGTGERRPELTLSYGIDVMTPAIMLIPEPEEPGRSNDMTDDSRWWREWREFMEPASVSADRWRPSSPLVRLSTLFLDRWKNDEAFPEEARDLT